MRLLVLALVTVCIVVVAAVPKHKEGSACKSDADCKAVSCGSGKLAHGAAHCHTKKCTCPHAGKSSKAKGKGHHATTEAAPAAAAEEATEPAATAAADDNAARAADGGDAGNTPAQDGEAPAA